MIITYCNSGRARTAYLTDPTLAASEGPAIKPDRLGQRDTIFGLVRQADLFTYIIEFGTRQALGKDRLTAGPHPYQLGWHEQVGAVLKLR